MPASIGVNLRVTGHCSQGGRKYMEDLFSVAYQQTEDERDLEYAFFGIYDGHGGSEAAAFAKEHLMDSIVKQRQFWSDNDEDVLKAIRNGYMLTHLNMWKELEKWPKTVTGLPSTAGTTASVAFIRRGKIYVGHVGDSAIVLGYQKEGSEEWAAKPLTSDHKPESTLEIERIQRCGGKVVSKAGVPRVVWNRPRVGHKGPIKKNTPMDEIPFLAVARSLGDLWSYNPQNDEFIVSPDPDVGVLTIDPSKFRCLIFGTDGLWNMISPEGAVSLVQATERHNEAALVGATNNQPRDWVNPSKSLVDHALERWSNTRMRADNTSVVTLMLDPPGPPRATVLRSRTAQKPAQATPLASPNSDAACADDVTAAQHRPQDKIAEANGHHVPQNGLAILTRYSDVDKPAPASTSAPTPAPLPPCATIDGRFSLGHRDEPAKETDNDADVIANYGNPAESYFMARLLNRTRVVNTLVDVYDEIVNGRVEGEAEVTPEKTVLPEAGDGIVHDGGSTEKEVVPSTAGEGDGRGDSAPAKDKDDVGIQINEVSSSSPSDGPPRPKGRRPKAEAKRDAPISHDRVLRSHHEPEPARVVTRGAATRGRGAGAGAAAAIERVVILSRRSTPPLVRAPPRRQPDPPPAPASPERPRATRSQRPASPAPSTAPQALAQKITRSISSIGSVARELRGNCARAPAPLRRAPAARREPSTGSKENLGARRRARGRPGAEPARGPQRRRADSPAPDREPVHSTTAAVPEPRLAASCAPAVERPRALRSRNDAAPPPPKRRCDEPPPAPLPKAPKPSRLPKLSAERCARALGKRASGPWAPALALRNRLRKRLTK